MILILILVGEIRVHLTETTLEIIQLLGSEPFSGESIRSLARRLNRAYPLIHTHISALREEGMILEKKVGRALQCTLNLSHPESQHLLGFVAAREQEQNLHKKLAQINRTHAIATACSYDDKVYIVVSGAKKRKQLEQEFPFSGVVVLNQEKFQNLLLTASSTGTFPTPVFHHATFFDHVGTLQQSLWGWSHE